MNQQMIDSMRALLSAIKEAEIEWMESKGQARIKSTVVVDRSDEIDQLQKEVRPDHSNYEVK